MTKDQIDWLIALLFVALFVAGMFFAVAWWPHHKQVERTACIERVTKGGAWPLGAAKEICP